MCGSASRSKQLVTVKKRVYYMKMKGFVWILLSLILAGCQTSEPQRAGVKPVVEEKEVAPSAPDAQVVSQKDLRASIVVPSEAPVEPESLKAQIVIPSEMEDEEKGDLRSLIVVPSEQVAEPKRDLRSMIVVPSEVADEKPNLRSKIYVPSES